MTQQPFRTSVICLVASLVTESALAGFAIVNPVSLDEVTVSPEEVIFPTEEVQLEISLVSGSCCIYHTQPTTTEFFGNNFVVSVFAESGALAIPDQRLEVATLGSLAPGDYNYDVDLTTSGGIFNPITERISGSFVVSPVPDADFNGNGTVEGRDFLDWQSNVGITSGATRDQGDADSNGTVDASDLAIWKAQYGAPQPLATAATTIPEPTSATLCIAAICLAIGRERRTLPQSATA